MSHMSRRARAVLSAALLTGLAGLSASSAFAADDYRPVLKLTKGEEWGQPIGDFNGDGLDDVIADTGQIVFGTRTPESLDLTRPLGAKGLTITSAAGASTKLVSAQPAGDLDNDGKDDLIANVAAGGKIFVVYGAAGNADVDLVQSSRVGVVTSPGTAATTYSPLATAVGDWNGDGIDDIAISRSVGALGTTTSTGASQGLAVIRGGARIANLSATSADARLQVITAAAGCERSYIFFFLLYSCNTRFSDFAPAGDFDGDGKDDIRVTVDYGAKSFVVRGRSAAGTINALAPTDAIALTGGGSYPSGGGGIGDVNADGKDDIAVPSADVNLVGGAAVILGRAGTAAVPVSSAQTVLGGVYDTKLSPAGDLNGDGRGDVVFQTYGDNATRISTNLLERGTIDGKVEPEIAGLRNLRAARLGDFDGDGKADLLGGGLWLVSRGGSGTDVIPPSLTLRWPEESVEPGASFTVTTSLDEAATVQFEVINDNGTSTYGTFTKQLAAGQQSFSFAAKDASGAPLPNNTYRFRTVARDAAGNATTAQWSERFYVYREVPTANTSVRVTSSVRFPDGLPLEQPLTTVFTAMCAPNLQTDRVSTTSQIPVSGSTAVALRAALGDECWLDADQPEQFPVEVAGCTWTAEWYSGGVRLPLQQANVDPKPIRPTLKINGGENQAEVRFVCAGGSRVVDGVPPFTAGSSGWWFDGTTNPSPDPNIFRLTPAKANFQSIATSRKVIDANNWKYSFTAQAAGGNGAAEGLTLSFLPESAPVKVGAAGGGLGIGGTGATVIAFDLSKGTTGPADQFIGISDSTMTGGDLNYQQTALAGHRMRGTAFTVAVVQKNGVLTVATNGVVRLTRTMQLPTKARVTFSGATGPKVYQEHLVSAFSMSRP